MDIENLEKQLIKIYERAQINPFETEYDAAKILAYADCTYKYLKKDIQLMIPYIKMQLENIIFDPETLYERYLFMVNHLYGFTIYDDDIFLLLVERLAIEIDKSYYKKIDFTKIINSDERLYEIFYNDKRKVLINYHRIKKYDTIKVANKSYFPYQYEVLINNICNNIDPTKG